MRRHEWKRGKWKVSVYQGRKGTWESEGNILICLICPLPSTCFDFYRRFTCEIFINVIFPRIHILWKNFCVNLSIIIKQSLANFQTFIQLRRVRRRLLSWRTHWNFIMIVPNKLKCLYFQPPSETSYTYAQFQKTGKLTAPATVIPRFRKYNVEDFHFLTVLGKGSFGKVSFGFQKEVLCEKSWYHMEEREIVELATTHNSTGGCSEKCKISRVGTHSDIIYYSLRRYF